MWQLESMPQSSKCGAQHAPWATALLSAVVIGQLHPAAVLMQMDWSVAFAAAHGLSTEATSSPLLHGAIAAGMLGISKSTALKTDGDDVLPRAGRRKSNEHWCSESPCTGTGTQPPCMPPPKPSPLRHLPTCNNSRCVDDLMNSGIDGKFPDGTDACKSSSICVRDVFPGCDCYRGDSDSAWGLWCEDLIAAFDAGGIANGSKISAHSPPKDVGSSGHPMYYFAAVGTPKWYVVYLPPANALPISADSGRYEYFLFQYLRSRNIGVFVIQTPFADMDLWDHVPPHTQSSPYHYDCAKIKSGYPFCDNPCDMCTKNRSTDLIEAAIDKASSLGYSDQILMGWSSGGSMASAFLNYAHQTGFKTTSSISYGIEGIILLSSGGQFC
eukprot:SAG31_NODE_9800_length_1225_cov_1.495560_1_plen_382_part_10